MKKVGKAKRILLVDDEIALCSFIKKNLETAGNFEVFICSDSLKALEQVSALQPDLILMDILMPGISGSEIAEKLKGIPNARDIPLIFLTAVATPSDAGDEGNRVGGYYVVAKPVQIDKLIRVIEVAAKGNRAY